MRLLVGGLSGPVSKNDRHASRSKARKIAVLLENTEHNTENSASNSDPSTSNYDGSQSNSDYRTRIAMRFSAFITRFSVLVIKQPIIAVRITDYAGGPASQTLGAAGTRNPA